MLVRARAENEAMAQISMPIRIVAVGALVFMALWMVALRPKTAVEPVAPAVAPAAAQPQTAAGRAVEAARDAAGTANDAARRNAGEPAPVTPGTSPGAPASTPTAKPAGGETAAAVGALGPVRTALAKNQVVALLFWDPKNDVDRAVRRALTSATSATKGVAVVSTTTGHLTRYGRITRAVRVLGTPTIIVVDANGQARSITGFVDSRVIAQAIADAKRRR